MEKKLIEHLISSDIVSSKELQRCMLRASMSESSVVDEMTNRLGVDQRRLAEVMADYWGLSFWKKQKIEVESVALKLIRAEMAKEYGVLPVTYDPDGELITLAVYDVEKAQPVIEKVRKKTGVSPKLVLAPRDVAEREIFRHYQRDSGDATPAGSSAPARGVLQPGRKRRRSRARPKKTSPGAKIAKKTSSTGSDDSPKTRKVDLTTDNPFMDLVQQSAKKTTTPPPDDDPPPATIAVQADDIDFFDGFEDAMSPATDEESSSDLESASSEVGEREISDIEGALDAFDAELNAESMEDEEDEQVLAPSSVDWGDAGSGSFPSRPSSVSGARSLSGADSGNNYETEGSGIFPLERDPSGFFDLGEETDGELTLAEVVDRQRRVIQKLEREIEYQKGILQTMAELLIEARVLSRRKLKSRLKALKKEQRERIDSKS